MYPIDCSYNIRYDRVGECLKSMYCYGSFLTILRKFDKAQRALHVKSCRFGVDITSIHRGLNFHEFFLCNFDGRKIQVVSTYFFQCNFDGRKIHFASTYFFRCSFDGRKIHLAITYFFRCNSSRRNIRGISTCFFQLNFDGQKNPLSLHVLFSTKF